MSGERIFHIATPADAERLGRDGVLEPPSLAAEGFVHLSTAAQVVATTERYYAPDAELVLVEVDGQAVADELQWPEVYPGQRYPHLHAPLRQANVIAVLPWGPEDRRAWR